MKKLMLLVLSLLMAVSVAACSSDVKEETFEASAAGFGGDVTVKVTFKGEDITKVEVSGPSETQGVGTNAIEQLPAKIEEADSADVDAVSGATITSDAIKSAVRKAIKQKNGETESAVSFTAGTYTSTVQGYRGEITGEVTFDETSIVSVNVTNCGDTFGIAYGMENTPVEALSAKIVETQSLGLDTVTGATVSSNAVIALVADAAAQAGADVDALKAVAVEKPAAEDVTYDVDVVVVGGGAAGLTAGISAIEAGAKVLIVEKQGITGGSTSRSGGKILGAGTDLMTEYGFDNNPDLLYDYLLEVGQDYINEDLLKPFVYGSADNLDYLTQHGVIFEDVEAGSYILRVSKENHVTREYEIEIAEDIELNIQLNLVGDINGDGKINTVDVARANAHAKSMSTLTGYEFDCVDINGDGKVNTVDVAKMNAHAKGITTLW